MKKIFTLITVLFVVFLFSNNSKAQGISLGIGGGLSTMQSPDALTNDISDGGAGFSAGWHLGAKAKFSIPLSPFTPIAFVNYHKFNGSGSSNIFGDVETSMHIWSIGVGGESKIIPGPISPYFQINIAYNNFGELNVERSLLSIQLAQNSESVSRFGVGLGVGVELIFIDASITYNFLNLIGKDDGEEAINTLNLSAYLML